MSEGACDDRTERASNECRKERAAACADCLRCLVRFLLHDACSYTPETFEMSSGDGWLTGPPGNRSVRVSLGHGVLRGPRGDDLHGIDEDLLVGPLVEDEKAALNDPATDVSGGALVATE